MWFLSSGLVAHPMSGDSSQGEVSVHAEHTQCQHTDESIIEDTGSRRLISNDIHHVPSMSIPKMVDTALPEATASTRSPLQVSEYPESLYLVKHPCSLDVG